MKVYVFDHALRRDLKSVIISNMSSIIEAFQRAKHRINPEGLEISATLTGASIFVIPPLQAALTSVLHEISREVPPDVIKLGAVGILACLNAASIIVESRTLRKKQYSASPIASTINVATGKPILSSALGHIVNFAISSGLNPVNIVNIVSLMAGDQGRMFAENAVGVGLALGLWNIGFNTLILNHRIDPVVKVMKNAQQAISKRFQRKRNPKN